MNKNITEPEKSYVAVALDPLHFGAGGYRIGRVDNTIIREPGTNLPKGPGTGLKGCIKFCADIILREYLPRNKGPEREIKITEEIIEEFSLEKKKKLKGFINKTFSSEKLKKDLEQATFSEKEIEEIIEILEKIYQSCAGTKGCGKKNCPICYTFGYSKDDKNFEGSTGIFDAHIALFPIYSSTGPKWIITEKICNDYFKLKPEQSSPDNTSKNSKTLKTVEPAGNKEYEQIRLGWLYLPVESYNLSGGNDLWTNLKKDYPEITENIVVTDYNIFSHLVNTNLEVRTSNSINPDTGAVDEGALFTYEALPATTVIKFDTILNAYREEKARKVSELGMYYLRHYGVGGMNTRGFGRLDVLNVKQNKNDILKDFGLNGEAENSNAKS